MEGAQKIETRPGPAMPAGIGNAYVFQVFNTISFSIVLGVPMILFFKHLSASATILGIVAALPPLLITLQIPAAHFVERVGYRAFVLRGWTARSFVILVIAGVTMLPAQVGPMAKMGLLLFLLFAFNASRGIATCGFLPWLTQLVPEEIRGQYLARDQISSALAFLGSMILSAVYLSGQATDARFAGIFAASFVAAMVSLWFLRRVPDVPVPERPRGTGSVPWREMLLYGPFLKLVIYNFTMCSAFAAAGVFWVPFLRDYHGVTDGQMLGIVALGNAAAVVSLLGFGSIIDRVGSRPLLALSGLSFMVHFACWGAVAGGLLPFNLWTILLIQLVGGLAGSLFNLANTRLAMATIPAMGRSHFFALFSVVQNVTLGMLPIMWGVVLDSLRNWQATWGPWQWNQYSVMYAVLTVTIGLGQFLQHRLTEARAMTTEMFFRELLVETPSRAVTRLRSRLPYSLGMFAIGSPVVSQSTGKEPSEPTTERPGVQK